MAESEPTFYRGDGVRHAATGREMRVEAVTDPSFLYCVRCSWAQDGQKQSGMFRPDQLELIGG